MSEKSDGIIYTAGTHTVGGRDRGVARSSDGCLDVRLACPESSGIGTNPEQLFAAGWSACFESSIALAARKAGVTLGFVTADAEVNLHRAGGDNYFLSARMEISIPGVDRATALNLIQEASTLCPYSKATRGNIAVTYNLV